MANKNLVLLSYGSETEYKRAIFCVLSFVSRNRSEAGKKIRILVYTDNPGFFKTYLINVSIDYIFLSDDLLKEMDGNTNYFHRRKVAAVDLTFKQYPNEGVLFIDTDTFFIADPEDLIQEYKQGTSFMHLREYNFREGLDIFASYNQPQFPIDFIQYISERDFYIKGMLHNFTMEDYSWNSGVLGLNSDFYEYMPDIYKLTDEFYANSKWFISEQLAFSLVLQKTTQIQSADQVVLHYWGKRQKVFMDKLLDQLLRQKIPAELNNKEFILALTKKWKKEVEVDRLMELAVIAITSRSWYFGFKKVIQITLNNPKYLALFCKELMHKRNKSA